MCKVSIIVPVFNVAPYLEESISSILSQSFTDYELLIVDDGSTDGSYEICDQLAEKDSRIRVFHKENGGVSSARNLGLKNAEGEWICFVDSDDILLPHGLQTMMDGVSEDVDLVLAGYYEWEGKTLQQDTSGCGNAGIIDPYQALLMMYPFTDYPYMGFAWGKLFRRSLIGKNNLLFDERIVIKEDTLFVVEYICGIHHLVYYTPIPIYNYIKLPTGAMGGLNLAYNPNYLTSFDAAVRMNQQVHQLPGISKALSKAAKFEVVNRVYRVYGHMLSNGVDDKPLVTELKRRAIREVGRGYYWEYQFWRNKRRIRNYLVKLLKRK